jgi:DNA-binding response OmpR family regulator
MHDRKVMIIDDDKEFLGELQEILDANGYDMTALTNSESAVDVAMESKPDVILMDLKMPGKSGFELADEISHKSELKNVPIIAMSAFFRDDFNSLMNLCGISKCLKKPFALSDAVSAIENAVKRN